MNVLIATATLLAEILRENKRMLDKAMRELDRERMGLQNQEKKTVAEIKKMAKEGQMVSYVHHEQIAALYRQSCIDLPNMAMPACLMQDAVKVMAKSLIRNRHAVTKLHALKSQLQAVLLRIQARVWGLCSTLRHGQLAMAICLSARNQPNNNQPDRPAPGSCRR